VTSLWKRWREKKKRGRGARPWGAARGVPMEGGLQGEALPLELPCFGLSVRWLCCLRKKGRGRRREEKKREEKKKIWKIFQT
jgi:hypothetical protein